MGEDKGMGWTVDSGRGEYTLKALGAIFRGVRQYSTVHTARFDLGTESQG